MVPGGVWWWLIVCESVWRWLIVPGGVWWWLIVCESVMRWLMASEGWWWWLVVFENVWRLLKNAVNQLVFKILLNFFFYMVNNYPLTLYVVNIDTRGHEKAPKSQNIALGPDKGLMRFSKTC